MEQFNQEPNKTKREGELEALGKDSNRSQEETEGENTSVDTSETIEDENQYDHMGDDKFKVDSTPEFTAGTGEKSFPICQRCGFNTQCRCSVGDSDSGTKM